VVGPNIAYITLESFVSRLGILEYGNKAAEHYGNIRATLEKARPNDGG
jgi:tRNA(fMet)-specific endonuclease VapC